MKKYLLWIAEAFIWLLVLFMVSGTIMLAKYNYKKNFNTYQVFLPDVDGLINGSPVRYMGIQVGYVNQVNIVGEEVYIKFIVTQKDFRLPKGSITTVEFAGLGGSKSLEIYPPKSPDKELSDKILIPQAPKRLNDALGVLNDMFDKIIKITYDVSNFMNEVGIIKKQEDPKSVPTQKSTKNALDTANKWFDDIEKKRNKID